MTRKKNNRRPWSNDLEDTLALYTGSFLVAVGGAGVFLLALTPWDWLNAVPKVLGIAVSGFVVVLGGILLQLPEERENIVGKLSMPLLALARAIRRLASRNVEEARTKHS
jgi:hypothetical protein